MHHRRPRRARIKRHLTPTPIHRRALRHRRTRHPGQRLVRQPHAPPPTRRARIKLTSPPLHQQPCTATPTDTTPRRRIGPLNRMHHRRPRRARIKRHLAPTPVNRRAPGHRRTRHRDERLSAVDRHRGERATGPAGSKVTAVLAPTAVHWAVEEHATAVQQRRPPPRRGAAGVPPRRG